MAKMKLSRKEANRIIASALVEGVPKFIMQPGEIRLVRVLVGDKLVAEIPVVPPVRCLVAIDEKGAKEKQGHEVTATLPWPSN